MAFVPAAAVPPAPSSSHSALRYHHDDAGVGSAPTTPCEFLNEFGGVHTVPLAPVVIVYAHRIDFSGGTMFSADHVMSADVGPQMSFHTYPPGAGLEGHFTIVVG